jgi:hypothetical protein
MEDLPPKRGDVEVRVDLIEKPGGASAVSVLGTFLDPSPLSLMRLATPVVTGGSFSYASCALRMVDVYNFLRMWFI